MNIFQETEISIFTFFETYIESIAMLREFKKEEEAKYNKTFTSESVQKALKILKTRVDLDELEILLAEEDSEEYDLFFNYCIQYNVEYFISRDLLNAHEEEEADDFYRKIIASRVIDGYDEDGGIWQLIKGKEDIPKEFSLPNGLRVQAMQGDVLIDDEDLMIVRRLINNPNIIESYILKILLSTDAWSRRKLWYSIGCKYFLWERRKAKIEKGMAITRFNSFGETLFNVFGITHENLNRVCGIANGTKTSWKISRKEMSTSLVV